MRKHDRIIPLWFSASIVASMGAILGVWTDITNWIAVRSEVERNLIYIAIPSVLGVLVWAVNKSAPMVRRGYNAWWTHRELRKPKEHELGFHDHRDRVKKLWRRLSYLRGDVYGLLGEIGKRTAGAREKKETAPAKFWTSLARNLERPTKKLEKVSAEMNAVTTLMLSSFRVVCGRSTQSALDALKLFTENEPSVLQWQMKEDMVAFLAVMVFWNDLKGEKYEVNRVCDRLQTALEAIRQSNISIFGACEAVMDGAKLPKPKLDPILVRATRPGSYANGKRRAGDVFMIQSDHDFAPDWMEKVKRGKGKMRRDAH